LKQRYKLIGAFAAAAAVASAFGFVGGSSEIGQSIALAVKQRFAPSEAVASTPTQQAVVNEPSVNEQEVDDRQTLVLALSQNKIFYSSAESPVAVRTEGGNVLVSCAEGFKETPVARPVSEGLERVKCTPL
jgi:hypothetical protein